MFTLLRVHGIRGLNFPDLTKYYEASQLVMIFNILQKDIKNGWLTLEQT